MFSGLLQDLLGLAINIQGYVNENTCKILIGNKCDMTAERQVSTEEAKKKAEEQPSELSTSA